MDAIGVVEISVLVAMHVFEKIKIDFIINCKISFCFLAISLNGCKVLQIVGIVPDFLSWRLLDDVSYYWKNVVNGHYRYCTKNVIFGFGDHGVRGTDGGG